MNIQSKPETYITKKGVPAKRITFEWTEEKIALAAKMWAEGFTSPATPSGSAWRAEASLPSPANIAIDSRAE